MPEFIVTWRECGKDTWHRDRVAGGTALEAMVQATSNEGKSIDPDNLDEIRIRKVVKA